MKSNVGYIDDRKVSSRLSDVGKMVCTIGWVKRLKGGQDGESGGEDGKTNAGH